MQTSLVLLLALCVPGSLGYGQYQAQLPNGPDVPHPCKPNYIWHGVGHKSMHGGGERNPFGVDFAAQGHKWTEALCRMDSDGDGLTNGQELGDPDCVWTEGALPSRTNGITHPGICDPWNEGECVAKNSWVDCSQAQEFTCDYINQPDVRNLTIRFPRTKVPAKGTSYMCYNFQLPDDQEYHLIATKPLINNSNVMHHMVLLGCDSTATLLTKPQDCVSGMPSCSRTLNLWGLGFVGECFDPMVGLRIGKGAYTMVSLQHHWTNPDEVDTWYDSSGLILYYTPKLRRYNSAVMTLGQNYLEIPPGMSSVVHQSTCTSRCSKQLLKGPIHIVSAFNHMHYLGIRQNVTLTKPGQATRTLTDDNPFNYDTPRQYRYDDPIVVNPGDELKTYCTYQSRSRARTTTWGPGSFDEMCFAFLTYYPAENLTSDSCTQWKNTDMCEFGKSCYSADIYNSSAPRTSAMIKKVLENCNSAGQCRAECPAAIAQVEEDNECFNRNMREFVFYMYFNRVYDPILMKFAAAVMTCDTDDQPGPGHVTPTPVTTRPAATPKENHDDPPSDAVKAMDEEDGRNWLLDGTTPFVLSTVPSKPAALDTGNMFLNIIKQVDARPLLQNIIMNVNYNNMRSGGDSDSGDDDHAYAWH